MVGFSLPIKSRMPFLAALVIPWLAGPDAFAQEPKADFAGKYHRDFTGLTAMSPEWGYYGPSAEKYLKFEREGVRITMPAGYDGQRPEAGLATRLAAKGDFEVTVGYEILAEPTAADAGEIQTRFSLSIFLAPPQGDVASLSHRVRKDIGPQLLAWKPMWYQAAGKNIFPAVSSKGRLQVVRTGSTLFYSVAEENAKTFRVLTTQPFGKADLAEVRFVASTGGPKAALDVRITELQIRAEAIPKPPTAPPPPTVAVNLAPPTKNYAREYRQPFKSTTLPQGWDLDGPDVESSLKFEAAGAHFTLPVGWPGQRKPTGMKSTFGVKGDFEITMRFEMLTEPPQADSGTPVGTRLSIGLVKDTPQRDTTTLGRVMTTNSGRVLVAWANLWDETAGKMVPHTGNIKATKTMMGRLRYVRSGGELYYGVSDGPDGEFNFFKKYAFGAEDISELRIIASTGTEKASLAARVWDLHVRADAIPGAPASQAVLPGQAIPVLPPTPPGKGRLAIALGGGFAFAVFVAAALGGVYLLRRRNTVDAGAGAPPAFVSLSCPACGAKLKAKAQRTGQKVKCPKCAEAVPIDGVIGDTPKGRGSA